MLWNYQLRRFSSNQRGNVAIIFALSLIPLLAIAGFALDAQIAFAKKERVQQAADSAALAAARLMQVDDDQSSIQQRARKYFKAIIKNGEGGLTCNNVEVTYPAEDSLTVTADCAQDTTLTGMLGRKKMNFEVKSTATYGVGKVDVAFVFDISGSMNSYGRLLSLKLAAKDAVDTLLPAPGSSADGDVRIAMVGYNSMIDAGPFFEEVTGLKKRRTYFANYTYTGKEEKTANGWHQACTCLFEWNGRCYYQRCENEYGPYTAEVDVDKTGTSEYTFDSSCVYERAGSKAFSDTQPKQVSSSKLLSRVQAGRYNASETSDNSEGYLTASQPRFTPYDQQSDRTASQGGTWSEEGTECRSSGQPFELNDNKVQIYSYISTLSANNGTAGHQGVEWGWYLLSPVWKDIFDHNAEPLPYDEPDATKAMIIMTDGAFNSQFHSSQGNSFEQAKAMCDAIKDEKVVIYTVAFSAPTEGEEVLEYCASGREFAFKASNGAELLESYQKIAASISDLRIQF